MKTLIIPDIHHKFDRAEDIIKKVRVDNILFLGDYFDSHQITSTNAAKETAFWLKDSLQQKDRIHLFGNHDVGYVRMNDSTYCSGWLPEKHTAIAKVMKESDWKKLKWVHWLCGNLLVSHAGVHPSWVVHPEAVERCHTNDNIARLLMLEEKRANRALHIEVSRHWFWAAGYARHGSSPYGGLTWLDYGTEFTNVPGLRQIVGHTPIKTRQVRADGTPLDANLKLPEAWQSVCLDTNLNHYATYESHVGEDGKLEIFKHLPEWPAEQT